MNAERRKRLGDIREKIVEIEAELESIRDDEDGARESMPESLQGGEQYEQSENASESIQSCLDELGGARTYLDDITGG